MIVPWIDLNLFYGSVKYGHMLFNGQIEKLDFPESFVVCDMKVGRLSTYLI